MLEITVKEAPLLVKFRENFTDLNLDEEKNSDAFLIRWLRARDLNLKKAEEMLRKHMIWREEYEVDKIMNWECPSKEKYEALFPLHICGYNSFGYPICIMAHRFSDPAGVLECDQKEYTRYSIQFMEKIMLTANKHSAAQGHRIYECVIIHDLDQANIRPYFNRRYMEFIKTQETLMNENYPEIVHKVYFLFAPKLFTVLYAILKHIIPKRTQEKFHIYGHDMESWKHDLLSHIPAETLPVRFGGKNAEFEKIAYANCKSHSSSNQDDLNMIVKSIPAGKDFKLEFNIQEPNAILKWSFRIEAYDIGFYVHRSRLNSKEFETLVEYKRINSAEKSEEGSIVCESEGQYELVFDNTYSRMRSKCLHYRAEVFECPNMEILN